ncbi:hypothetical protein SKAU_G00383700 [Synaphobranchus kaupii]|uniref:Uncharacterized protein n=1 Tax=Synaphobranchus kaupii TaxID=118154 RepID=A0A9Q1EE77_SYNKA|nr:hypothetical protein SKAU_G00383700 [Synaphobranchus kaupii]
MGRHDLQLWDIMETLKSVSEQVDQMGSQALQLSTSLPLPRLPTSLRVPDPAGSRCAADYAVEFRTLAAEFSGDDAALQGVFRNKCISTLQPHKFTHSTLQLWPMKLAHCTHQLQSMKLTRSTWSSKLACSTRPQKPPCTTHQLRSLKPTRSTRSSKLAFLSPALLACFGFLSPVLCCRQSGI